MRDALSFQGRARWPVSDTQVVRRRVRHTSYLNRWLAARLQRWAGKAGIRIELWDGWSPWTADTTSVGDLVVSDPSALLRLMLDPDFQFGEMYMAGRVEVRGPLDRVMEAAARLPRRGRLSPREWLALHVPRANSLLLARRNIHHHYDLGNDFYSLWLDRLLVYTCAYFPAADASLEEAQIAKFDLVCRKLDLRPGETVLEAGCGWGTFALHMARQYGVRVKAFNISREQLRYARERAAQEDLASQVEFIDDDYRNVSGRFDAFVSVGMLEHVGRPHYKALGEVIRRVLPPGSGRGLLHFIGRHRPQPLNTWTRRRIFPGAYPPTVSEVARHVLEPAGQTICHVENLRLHYALTLRHWRERFERAHDEIRRQFGDPFARAWYLYLAASEAAFTTGWLQLFQIVFAPATASRVYATAPLVNSAEAR